MTTRDLMDGLPEIARGIDRAASVLLGLDFDGTLAPIRPRPDEVELAESVRAILAALAARPGVTLMIVSGRSRPDVASRIRLPGLIYAGNHGLEIQGPGLDFVEPRAALLVERLREHSGRLREQVAAIPGVLVEPKGLTTSVHYRNVPPPHRDAVAEVVRAFVSGDPDRFVLTSGHLVWEIRPRVSWHKGDAIHWVLDRLGDPANRLVFYLGDDRTDEDAFSMLPEGVTVRVGDVLTPTQARFRLDGPPAVEQFLAWLLGEVSRPRDPSNPTESPS